MLNDGSNAVVVKGNATEQKPEAAKVNKPKAAAKQTPIVISIEFRGVKTGTRRYVELTAKSEAVKITPRPDGGFDFDYLTLSSGLAGYSIPIQSVVRYFLADSGKTLLTATWSDKARKWQLTNADGKPAGSLTTTKRLQVGPSKEMLPIIMQRYADANAALARTAKAAKDAAKAKGKTKVEAKGKTVKGKPEAKGKTPAKLNGKPGVKATGKAPAKPAQAKPTAKPAQARPTGKPPVATPAPLGVIAAMEDAEAREQALEAMEKAAS